MTAKLKKTPEMMLLLKFDADDLAANRQGYLTSRQRDQLRQQSTEQAMMIALGGILACIVCGLCLAALPRIQTSDILALLALVLLTLASGVGTIFALSKFIASRQNYATDIQQCMVRYVRGRLSKRNTTKGKAVYYHLKIADKEFRVKSHIFDTFEADQAYILYYVPNTSVLIAAESVRHEGGHHV